jgi:hypothetical protein
VIAARVLPPDRPQRIGSRPGALASRRLPATPERAL